MISCNFFLIWYWLKAICMLLFWFKIHFHPLLHHVVLPILLTFSVNPQTSSYNLRLLPTFRGGKIWFFFYLTELNSNIQPNVSKKSLKSLKVPKILRKMSFQIKVNNWGKCHNLGPWQVIWENFWGIRSTWGSFFMLFSYFVYTMDFTKFTCRSFLLMERWLLMGKSKMEESPW